MKKLIFVIVLVIISAKGFSETQGHEVGQHLKPESCTETRSGQERNFKIDTSKGEEIKEKIIKALKQ